MEMLYSKVKMFPQFFKSKNETLCLQQTTVDYYALVIKISGRKGKERVLFMLPAQWGCSGERLRVFELNK